MSDELTAAIRVNFLVLVLKAYASLNKGKRLTVYPYLKLMAQYLVAFAQGRIRRLLITLPPRHAKTFMGSICLSAWILAHQPSAKILVISYGQELADKIAFAIREILTSDWFAYAFTTRLSKKRHRLMDFVTTAGGGVRSVSIEGGVTGLGADYIIMDDPLQIKDCANEKQIQHVNTLFDSEIRTRLDNQRKGGMLIIAHRLNEDDLPGHVLHQGGWKQLKLPLIATRTRSYELSDGKVWTRRKGELPRPDAYDARGIDELRAATIPGFETLQQQNPGGVEGLRLKVEHFPLVPTYTFPLQQLGVVLSIDPGQKAGPTNSYAVMQAWVAYDGAHLLLDQWREHVMYREFRAQVKRFVQKFRPSVVLIEATGQGPAIHSEIRPRDGMTVMLITPKEDKVARLIRHARLLRGRRVRLAEGAPWTAEFVAEVTAFPYADFDDQVDAMTQYLDYSIAHPLPKPRPPGGMMAMANSRGITLLPRSGSSTPSTPSVMELMRRRWRKTR